MEFLLISGSTYKLYHSLSRLCKDNGMDPKMLDRSMLPAKTPKGIIIGLIPDTRR